MTGLVRDPALRQSVNAGMERQKAFGWTVAWVIFLESSGGGIFLVSYVLAHLYYRSPLLQTGQILGPLMAAACAACLMVDLGNKASMPRLFGDIKRSSSSWMARGSYALAVFVVFGLAYSLPFWPWAGTALNGVLGVVAAVLSIVLVVYTGFLLGVVKSIPFWNNALLPVLFLVSGLVSGTAILLAILGISPSQGIPGVMKTLTQSEMALIFIQLIMLWAYLGISTNRDIASAESVKLIKLPIIFIIVVGLVIPIVLLAYSAVLSDTAQSAPAELIASVLVLAGALFLRLSILNAGVYPRLQTQ